MRRSTLLFALGALVLAPAARAQSIQVDYDHSVNFGAFKSFFVSPSGASTDPIADRRDADELTAVLMDRGLRQAATRDDADLIVTLHQATADRRRLTTFYDAPVWGGWRWGWMGAGMRATAEHDFTVGTIIVDIFDRERKDLVWRGIARAELPGDANKTAKTERKAVDKLLKQFPPTGDW